MRINDLLAVESICLDGAASSKVEVLNKMVDLMCKSGKVSDRDNYLKAVLAREEESTTGVGEGIAIPHGRCAGVNAPGLAAMVVPAGVEYEALDDEPVNLIFLIGAPEGGGSVHIDILSKLSMLLMDDDFTAALRGAKTVEEFRKIIDDAETAKDAADAAKAAEAAATDLAAEKAASKEALILAVTACPTGIAHTFMAAEAIEKAAKAAGAKVKVETRGSSGAKNVLTAAEIAAADGIIVAADTNVPMDRFDGKKVSIVKVADGIHKADELVEAAINGTAPVYKAANGGTKVESSETKDSIGHQLYKHLMSGVSHMLPFVIGGGILIAIAFLLDDYSIDPSNFGMNLARAAFFKKVGVVAFDFMLPILAGYIAMSIADRPGLMVGFVGGSLAAAGTSFSNYFNPEAAVISGGFLGALAAGFIAGYVVLGLKKLTDKMPQSMDGLRPMLIYPVGGLFVIGVIMYAVNPFFAWLNTLLNTGLNSLGGANAIILGAIVGGMMSIDMGGPFNKAAYVFGTGSLAAASLSNPAGYKIMAAVMVGGMVPPIAIAIASWAFKNKFTDNDRKAAPVNAIMGLCFISEAAIPYAAADPARVIPACVFGSAVAGALSEAFGCTLMAPHGGLFVIPTIGNTFMYIVSLIVGSVAGAVLLGLLKKKVEA